MLLSLIKNFKEGFIVNIRKIILSALCLSLLGLNVSASSSNLADEEFCRELKTGTSPGGTSYEDFISNVIKLKHFIGEFYPVCDNLEEKVKEIHIKLIREGESIVDTEEFTESEKAIMDLYHRYNRKCIALTRLFEIEVEYAMSRIEKVLNYLGTKDSFPELNVTEEIKILKNVGSKILSMFNKTFSQTERTSSTKSPPPQYSQASPPTETKKLLPDRR